MRPNEIAATIHADMCDDNRNGYSWDPRTGGDHPDGSKTLVIDGREYTYALGSWDCSSSLIESWRLAIQYTKYAGTLDGATFTGNMEPVFLASGLFDAWDTASTEAERGDPYLNITTHTAMCQDGGNDGVYGYDCLSEFSGNEFGGAYGGEVGDQTGWESHITGFYDYPWDLTLHYNGAADDAMQPAEDAEPARSEVRQVQLYPSNGTDAQKWVVEWDDKTWFRLRNVACGKYLDVLTNSSEAGTAVGVYPGTGNPNQKWRFEQRMGETTVSLAPGNAEDMRLDCMGGGYSQGTRLIIWNAHGKPNQDWAVLDNRDGTVTLINNSLGEKLALDVVAGGA